MMANEAFFHLGSPHPRGCIRDLCSRGDLDSGPCDPCETPQGLGCSDWLLDILINSVPIDA